MAKVGRPRKEIDQKIFEKLCALQCTQKEIQSWFEVSDKTLFAWCRRAYGENFSVIWAQKAEKGKISLRRKQWHLAEKSPAMAIFLGKNILGQSDKVEQVITDDGGIQSIEVNLVNCPADNKAGDGNEG